MMPPLFANPTAVRVTKRIHLTHTRQPKCPLRHQPLSFFWCNLTIAAAGSRSWNIWNYFHLQFLDKYIIFNQMARKRDPWTPIRTAYWRSRSQARWRGESWPDEFTFDQWWAIWRPWFHQRGRGVNDSVMIRVDDSLPWGPSNVDIVERWEYLTPRGRYWMTKSRHGKKISNRKKN